MRLFCLQLKALAKSMSKKDGSPGLLLIVNPQWETRGLAFGQSGEGTTAKYFPQLAAECGHVLTAAEFGFGTRRAESEALVASLQPSYSFQQLRLQGDYVRVLRAYPGKWQVR